MGLFSFGSKEKKEQPRRAEPDTITSLALQNNLGSADLDYLLEAYATEAWAYNKAGYKHAKATRELCGTIADGITYSCKMANDSYEKHEKILSTLDAMLSRLNDISRRLDALEQSREITERTR